jgi:hypothetical protein
MNARRQMNLSTPIAVVAPFNTMATNEELSQIKMKVCDFQLQVHEPQPHPWNSAGRKLRDPGQDVN